VSDQGGGVVPGAAIVITNVDTEQSRNVTTDASGLYYVPALSSGRYKVTASAAGFGTAVQQDVALTVGLQQVLNFTLRPQQVSEQIEVKGEAAVVQTSNASISELVDSQKVRALPLNGRSFDQLIYLQPGVNVATSAGNSPNQGRGVKFSVGGARLTSNLFMLDGTDLNDSQNFTPGGAGGQLLGVESILEFQVITHNASAQYGRSMGAIINAVSKSGTNALHGDAYEFLRNSALDAKNFFDDPASLIPAFARNQFGAAVGGPVRRNRVFFFANYEGLRERLGEYGDRRNVHSNGTNASGTCLESTICFGGRPPFFGASDRHNVRSNPRTNSASPRGRPVCVFLRIASASASSPVAARNPRHDDMVQYERHRVRSSNP
jgi:hypothetical protein